MSRHKNENSVEASDVLEIAEYCGKPIENVRLILVEATVHIFLARELGGFPVGNLDNEKQALVSRLYALTKELDYDEEKIAVKSGKEVELKQKNILALLRRTLTLKKIREGKDPVIKMLSYFIRGKSRKPDVYKLRLLWCLVKKCDQAYKAFEKLKEVVEIVSAHPDSIDGRIKKPMSNPINEELEVEGEKYKMAAWFLFLLHLAGFKTNLSSLWETIKIHGEKAVRRLNEIFEEVYGDRVSQVKKGTAVQIGEILTKKGAVKTRKRGARKTGSKKKRNVSLPILVTPLMGSDPMLSIELEKEGNLIKGEAVFLPWNVRDMSREFWILRGVGGGGNVDDILGEQMLEAGYAKIDVGEGTKGKFIWEMYLEGVERYFNFASGWNEFLKEMMEGLTLWKKYLIFINLYLIWILWGQVLPFEKDEKFREKIIRFLEYKLFLRRGEVIVALKELGFEMKEIKKMMKGSFVLKTSRKNIMNVYSFLKKRLGEKWVVRVIKKAPNLLTRTLKKLEEKMTWLEREVGKEWAAEMIRKAPNLLTRAIEKLEENMAWLEKKLGERWAKKTVRKSPNLLALAIEKLEEKMTWLERKVGKEGAEKVIRGAPNVLTLTIEKLEEKMEFLEGKVGKEGAEKMIKKNPILLSLSRKALECHEADKSFEECLKEIAYRIFTKGKKGERKKDGGR